MLKKILGVATSLFLIASASEAIAEPYKSIYLKDISTKTVLEELLHGESRGIKISVSYELGSIISQESFPANFVARQVLLSEKHIRRFNSQMGLRSSDCRSSYDVNIYVISNEKMWEEDRFYSYRLRTNLGSERRIYGFYDSTLEIPRNNVLIITNVDERENLLTLQHELAHYWFDRLCVKSNYKESSEIYALTYEEYVIRNYEDFR
jgi:hypothetical protein